MTHVAVMFYKDGHQFSEDRAEQGMVGALRDHGAMTGHSESLDESCP